jgi:hypothetical protein
MAESKGRPGARGANQHILDGVKRHQQAVKNRCSKHQGERLEFQMDALPVFLNAGR